MRSRMSQAFQQTLTARQSSPVHATAVLESLMNEVYVQHQTLNVLHETFEHLTGDSQLSAAVEGMVSDEVVRQNLSVAVESNVVDKLIALAKAAWAKLMQLVSKVVEFIKNRFVGPIAEQAAVVKAIEKNLPLALAYERGEEAPTAKAAATDEKEPAKEAPKAGKTFTVRLPKALVDAMGGEDHLSIEKLISTEVFSDQIVMRITGAALPYITNSVTRLVEHWSDKMDRAQQDHMLSGAITAFGQVLSKPVPGFKESTEKDGDDTHTVFKSNVAWPHGGREFSYWSPHEIATFNAESLTGPGSLWPSVVALQDVTRYMGVGRDQTGDSVGGDEVEVTMSMDQWADFSTKVGRLVKTISGRSQHLDTWFKHNAEQLRRTFNASWDKANAFFASYSARAETMTEEDKVEMNVATNYNHVGNSMVRLNAALANLAASTFTGQTMILKQLAKVTEAGARTYLHKAA